MKNYCIYTVKEKIKQCCKIVQTYLKTLFLKIFKNYPVLQTERFVGTKFKKQSFFTDRMIIINDNF